jgi:hypothetical protein
MHIINNAKIDYAKNTFCMFIIEYFFKINIEYNDTKISLLDKIYIDYNNNEDIMFIITASRNIILKINNDAAFLKIPITNSKYIQDKIEMYNTKLKDQKLESYRYRNYEINIMNTMINFDPRTTVT